VDLIVVIRERDSALKTVILRNADSIKTLNAYIFKRYDAMAAREEFMTFRAFLSRFSQEER
jgi:hypothetical protein